jgi:DNA adenine methylase
MSTGRLHQQLPRCYPFVKWAGGKSQLLYRIETLIPPKFDRYFEPFLGGGALFFYLSSHKNFRFDVFLSDINEELIGAYSVIRDSVEGLITALMDHQVRYRLSPKTYYYKLRDMEFNNSVEKAARVIALNKTCYNGLYRVNKKQKFNVPMGRFNNPTICDTENLKNISILLGIEATFASGRLQENPDRKCERR